MLFQRDRHSFQDAVFQDAVISTFERTSIVPQS
jgi:hypothetical protein